MKTAKVLSDTGFPPVGELRPGTPFYAELHGHGVTLTVELHWNNGRPYYLVAGPKYRLTAPACHCERIPCVGSGRPAGRCKQLDVKGKTFSSELAGGRHITAGDHHSLSHCHGRPENRHAQHVMAYVQAALATYGPAGRPKPFAFTPRSAGPLKGWCELAGVDHAEFENQLTLARSTQ